MTAFDRVPLGAKIRRAILTATGVTLILPCAALFGTLYLRPDLAGPEDLLRAGALMASAVAASCGLAWFLSARLGRLALDPIARLARTMNQISSRRDFTLRAEKRGPDELGVLIDAFNDLLSQIQVHDGAREVARNELESRILERTAQLQSVNREVISEAAERKRAEESARESDERYRQLIDLLPDAVVVQSEGRLAYVNSIAVSLFGANSPDELIGRPVLDFVPRESREEMISRIRKAYEGARRSRLYEDRLARLDGSTVDVEVASILFNHGGKPAVLIILRDITHRKEVERMKTEFVSTVSHELRTPITSIQGSLGLIANGVMGALPAAAKPLVDIAYKNCQRLVLLINDILDVEKIAAGKMRFSFKPLDIGSLVEQAIESNRAYAGEFGVTLTLRNEAPGARVNADSDRLIQVLTNLLSNAAKFSPHGETVSVIVARKEGSIRVEVADRGPGIADEFRKRIFQKFSQADSTDVRQKGGSGLGLAICKSIIERHGGRISFETEFGRGTRFLVDLPLFADVAVEDIQPVEPSTARALICEFDPQLARFIRMILSRAGIHGDIAGSASQAVAMIQKQSYDFMTLDLELPDHHDAEFLADLRSATRARRLPIIAISGAAASPPEDLNASGRRMIDTLDKPIDPQRLLSAARTAIQARRAKFARVLHVEGDADVRQLVSYTLRTAAETSGVATLEEARRRIDEETFDLVVLNTALPDGSGKELETFLSNRVPFVFFNARRAEGGGTYLLASGLVKSLASCPDLPESLQAWVRCGMKQKPQYFDSQVQHRSPEATDAEPLPLSTPEVAS